MDREWHPVRRIVLMLIFLLLEDLFAVTTSESVYLNGVFAVVILSHHLNNQRVERRVAGLSPTLTGGTNWRNLE